VKYSYQEYLRSRRTVGLEWFSEEEKSKLTEEQKADIERNADRTPLEDLREEER
jgi:hypothetical protein